MSHIEPIKIRPYTDEDWLSICQIHDKARLDELKDSVDIKAFIPLEIAAEKEGLFDYEVWVATLFKKVTGFIAFHPNEVAWLYVDPSLYRQGIGKVLIEFALQKCEGIVSLEVLSGNKQAVQFYLSQGFEIKQKSHGNMPGNENFKVEVFEMEKVIN